MDDTPQPEPTAPPAMHTAQALRELHDRARNALLAQRERMSRLEVQLTQQLDSIASTVAEQIAAHGGSTSDSSPSTAEIEQLRQEYTAAQAAWQTEREQLASQASDQMQPPASQRAELEAATAKLAVDRDALDERQRELESRATELQHLDRELSQRQELLDAYADQCAAQQSQITATESALDKQRSIIAEREAALEAAQTDLERARGDFEAREQTWRNGLAELTSQRESLAAERAALEADLTNIELQRADFAAERKAMNAEQSQLAANNQLQGDELNAQLADAQRQLAEERAARERERASVDEQRRLLAKERDELSTALDAARTELVAAREQAGAAAERDELQQKFELALHDLQKLRGRVAELEQELDSRPAANESESTELIHLRAERDALAERVKKLEERPAVATDGDADQERADLQRRFELAVEDVRELKKKNAELNNRLAAVATAAPVATGGGTGWEAMKQRMLANLEGEGDGVDDEREVERATIENTIRITDEAMAAKDREIAQLRTQIAEGIAQEPDENEVVRQLVDADSVIAEHRERIAKLEAEIEAKLRAAELEMSVERATLARERVQLADLKAELESQRTSGEVPAAPGVAHPPKRRWLSKLGLNGDDPA